MDTQKPIHSLIIDTGPLIKNTVSISTLLAQAEEIYTTPAVLAEIRDPATRARVETSLLPFLKLRHPTPASYEAVTAFSKKTGDFPVLSKQDLGLLALAYEIHCQKHHGDVGLRRAPRGEIVKGPEKQEEEKKEEEKKEEEKKEEEKKEEETQEEKAIVDKEAAKTDDSPEKPSSETIESTTNKPTETATRSAQEPAEILEEGISQLQVSSSSQQISESASEEASQVNPQEDTSSDDDDDDDDDGEWITPHNLKQHQAKDSGVSSSTTTETQMGIATMTTDFAMQNVLLQMNLNLLSTNLQRISTLRTFILRCHACFLTTKEIDKQFCPRCGQPTLNRVSCSTSASGEFKIHLSKNYQHNNRGNKYSLPKPVGGSANGKMNGKGGGKGGWARELVLAEDQKEYMKHAEQEKRTKTRDLMDEDYLPGILTGDRGRNGGRMKIGAGKNVNSRKRV
ncbi:20S-pre-rRNA D-site endonuclease NOB1 [Pleomassaria siparia CBS 279.74]|uniref:20S-pre-rRNA D-site endonuclease NOB1 n=1 Tax=Pleomassaria siparia CBS 279.74 TaxID=1314801 RepID=A0A6G1JR75_9PLEO|nr:20S-pre-rRNA D-site endonuclease NOB1 [Pleomassaria siparia CBS 279.74]